MHVGGDVAVRGGRAPHPRAEFPESRRRGSTYLFTAGTAAYAVSIGVALISPYLCLVFHGALALYYAFDPVSRRVEHASEP
jgi:hypothetical protein